jgi:hypothetical protein
VRRRSGRTPASQTPIPQPRRPRAAQRDACGAAGQVRATGAQSRVPTILPKSIILFQPESPAPATDQAAARKPAPPATRLVTSSPRHLVTCSPHPPWLHPSPTRGGVAFRRKKGENRTASEYRYGLTTARAPGSHGLLPYPGRTGRRRAARRRRQRGRGRPTADRTPRRAAAVSPCHPRVSSPPPSNLASSYVRVFTRSLWRGRWPCSSPLVASCRMR